MSARPWGVEFEVSRKNVLHITVVNKGGAAER
eukprot:COSAG03_NODE_4751_length_1444_cov_0.973234_2_plen_31_part_01